MQIREIRQIREICNTNMQLFIILAKF